MTDGFILTRNNIASPTNLITLPASDFRLATHSFSEVGVLR